MSLGISCAKRYFLSIDIQGKYRENYTKYHKFYMLHCFFMMPVEKKNKAYLMANTVSGSSENTKEKIMCYFLVTHLTDINSTYPGAHWIYLLILDLPTEVFQPNISLCHLNLESFVLRRSFCKLKADIIISGLGKRVIFNMGTFH